MAREGALFQREVAPHLANLEEAGLRRLGPAEATTYVATRTEQYAALPEGDPRRLDEDAAARLRARLPEVEAWADRLLGLGLPLTLVHNDLHGYNVFSVDGRMRFFDFGDAVLSDPLSVLLVVVRSLMFRLECEPDDPRLTRVSDAALEPWSDLAPLPDLRAALDAGLQLGKLARSESWAAAWATSPTRRRTSSATPGPTGSGDRGVCPADRVRRHSDGFGCPRVDVAVDLGVHADVVERSGHDRQRGVAELLAGDVVVVPEVPPLYGRQHADDQPDDDDDAEQSSHCCLQGPRTRGRRLVGMLASIPGPEPPLGT